MAGRVLAFWHAWCWTPALMLAALLLSRLGLVHRAYGIVVGRDWFVLAYGQFSHLRLLPSTGERSP